MGGNSLPLRCAGGEGGIKAEGGEGVGALGRGVSCSGCEEGAPDRARERPVGGEGSPEKLTYDDESDDGEDESQDDDGDDDDSGTNHSHNKKTRTDFKALRVVVTVVLWSVGYHKDKSNSKFPIFLWN